MATNYPSALDSYTTLVDNSDDVLAAHMNDRGDAIEALEAKVGVDSSAVTSSHDYKLRNLPGQDGNWDAGAVEIRAQTFESDVTTGTAPFTIASTTAVSNLNVDQVDGFDAGNSSGQVAVSNGTVCTNLNADQLDGQHGSYYRDADNINAGTLATTYGGTNADFSATVQGSILYFSGAGVISSLGPGTSGELLKTNGAGANPEWTGGLGLEVFDTTGTWTCPTGITGALIWAVAGGAGGLDRPNDGGGGGGSSGNYVLGQFLKFTASSTYTITIGAGGAAGVAGGDTTVVHDNGTLTIPGGNIGSLQTGGAADAASPQTLDGGDDDPSGNENIGGGGSADILKGGDGGDSIGNFHDRNGGGGGGNPFGKGGKGGSISKNDAGAGTGYGSGGGGGTGANGSASEEQGAAGAGGLVIIMYGLPGTPS